MSKCQGDPCAAGLCKGKCSTGMVAPGPMLARSLLSYHRHETSRKRSSVQGQRQRIRFSKHRLNTRQSQKHTHKKRFDSTVGLSVGLEMNDGKN